MGKFGICWGYCRKKNSSSFGGFKKMTLTWSKKYNFPQWEISELNRIHPILVHVHKTEISVWIFEAIIAIESEFYQLKVAVKVLKGGWIKLCDCAISNYHPCHQLMMMMIMKRERRIMMMEMIAGRLRRLRLAVRTQARSQTQQVAQSILISNHLLSISDCCNIIMQITIIFPLQIKVANCSLMGGFIYMCGVCLRCPIPIVVDSF